MQRETPPLREASRQRRMIQKCTQPLMLVMVKVKDWATGLKRTTRTAWSFTLLALFLAWWFASCIFSCSYVACSFALLVFVCSVFNNFFEPEELVQWLWSTWKVDNYCESVAGEEDKHSMKFVCVRVCVCVCLCVHVHVGMYLCARACRHVQVCV